VIQGVEHLEPELQVEAFEDGEVFGQAGVDVERGRAIDHIPCAVAEGSIRSWPEGGGVEVALEPIRSATLTHLEGCTGKVVGAVAAVGLATGAGVVFVERRIGGVEIGAVATGDAERCAGLESDDGTESPASERFTKEQASASHAGRGVDEVGDPVEWDAQAGDAAVPAKVERIPNLGRSEGDVAGAGDVEGLLPGEAGLSLEAVRELMLRAQLE
jgi:hypothetical protein